jgi:hypothetical protein
MALSDGLVEYWPLNEASGNRVGLHAGLILVDQNAVGTNTGLTYANAIAIAFGAEERLLLADNVHVSAAENFTYAGAVWLDDVPGFNYHIMRKRDVLPEYEFYLNAGGRLEWLVWDEGGVFDAVSTDVVSAGAWIRWLVYHDGTNNQLGIAINDGTPATMAWTTGIRDSTSSFAVGDNAFAGRIGPLVRWNRVLSGAERTEWDNGGSLLTYDDLIGVGGGGGGEVPARARHHYEMQG